MNETAIEIERERKNYGISLYEYYQYLNKDFMETSKGEKYMRKAKAAKIITNYFSMAKKF